MNILHVNTYDQGGAANSCLRLHQGLLDQGINSRVLILSGKENREKNIYQYPNLSSIPNRFHKCLKGLSHQALLMGCHLPEVFSFADTPYDIKKTIQYQEADIINLHWTGGFLDWESFFKDNDKTIVWTLHDMQAFAGGCHYLSNYNSFITGYPYCPHLDGALFYPEYSKSIYEQKIAALKSSPKITIVSPSKWLYKLSHSSKLLGNYQHYCIPYGISSQSFTSIGKLRARQLLKLPQGKKILLFAAQSIFDKRKGYSILLKALDMISDPDLLLVAVGWRPNINNIKTNIIYAGNIGSEKEMSQYYCAADYFVIPSVEDNLPNTVLESLMCGTPVIGFSIGGVSEMVHNGRNGWLVDSISPEGLAKKINQVLASSQSLDRQAIRRAAVIQYNLPVQANKYIKLYKSLLHDSRSH